MGEDATAEVRLELAPDERWPPARPVLSRRPREEGWQVGRDRAVEHRLLGLAALVGRARARDRPHDPAREHGPCRAVAPARMPVVTGRCRVAASLSWAILSLNGYGVTATGSVSTGTIGAADRHAHPHAQHRPRYGQLSHCHPTGRAGRGSRKDFVDLYVYAREVASLEQLFGRFREKYRGVRMDPYHLLRSLTFFDDAESEAMPDLVAPMTWEEIKAFFRAEATRLFHAL
jgi:hypothetical protein